MGMSLHVPPGPSHPLDMVTVWIGNPEGLGSCSGPKVATSILGHLLLQRDSKSSITYISMCIQMPQVYKVYVYEYVCVKQYCIYITTFMILPLLLA